MSNVFDDLKQRALEISKKQELVKDYIAQLEAVQAIDAEIKELQERRKAVIAADAEIFALTNEIKELSKEFGKAAKSRRDEDEDYDADDETLYLELRTDHLTRIDPYSGTYVFDIEDYDTKFRVVFTEEVKGRPNYQIGASDF